MAKLPSGRKLRMEPLEDRRMLALAHDPGGFDQGLLHTEADFARMAAGVAAQEQPWLAGWQALQSEGYAQLGANPRPLETVIRGGADNYVQMHIDIQRSYLLAVRWKVSGDTAYANKAVEFLNAWKNTMTNLTGDSNVVLAAGIYGYQWANVAEIMRTYSGWAASDAEEFGDWLALHFAQKSSAFLAGHNGANITHYWANWDMCSIASLMAIGVYNDDQAMYDEAIDYLHNGEGNGALDRFVYYVHDGNLGQFQESGRDQGHTTLGVALGGAIMQMAWNQGDDLFGYDNNRFAAAVEYISKYNLGEDVPFEQFAWEPEPWNDTAYQNEISPAGRGVFRPGWELVYNHYANIKGIDLPWTEQVIDNVYGGVEGWSRNGDQFGFGTLTYSLDPFDANQTRPSGLTAVNYEAGVKLNWWGAVYADSHNVYRATSEFGPYTQIASGVDDLLTYVDHTAPAGEYWYKVTGVIGGAETDFSDAVRISSAPELIAHLEFNEAGGTNAADSTGNGVDGTLAGGASFTLGQNGNAVDINGGSQHVELPNDIMAHLSDFTIATWVRLDSLDSWARIFDFGDSNGRYMFLTPRAGSGNVRFAIATNYRHNEDIIEGDAPLPTGQWVHVAVTQSGTTGRLYINGDLVGSNTQMHLNPDQVGGTERNWLGRSQYPDPNLNGKIDDFRIYNGALSAGDVYELATGVNAPAVPAAPATLNATSPVGGNGVDLSWSAVASSYYTVKRASAVGGPYYTVATQVTGTTWSDTGLPAGETYHYVVVAANAGGESAASPTASATVLPPLPGTPTSVTAAAISSSQIRVTWSQATDAETYVVKRTTMPGAPYEVVYTTLASGWTATEYVDDTAEAGQTYYYAVLAENASGEGPLSAQAVGIASELTAWFKLDETIGATAADSSGNLWNADLVNGPTWDAGKLTGAVRLDGADDYVDLPEGVLGGLTDFTISTWVYLDSVNDWERIFDFGTGTNVNMFLTPKHGGGNNDLRFAIKNGGAEQQINPTTTTNLAVNTWTHVVVTLGGGVGVLYVDGAEVGRNNAITITPADLGSTHLNYIGKSQYADPYLDGMVDDFRILNRALSAGEVAAMFNLPLVDGDFNRDGKVNAIDYAVWREAIGQPVPAFSGGDANGDGFVREDDFASWLNNYGAEATPPGGGFAPVEQAAEPPAAAPVAEPTDNSGSMAVAAPASPLVDDAFGLAATPSPTAPAADADDLLLYMLGGADAIEGAESTWVSLDVEDDDAESHDAGIEALFGDLVEAWS